jgi:hypothetical protein
MRALVLLIAFLIPAAGEPAQPGELLTVRVDGRDRVLSSTDLAKVTRHDERIIAEGTGETATVSGIRLWDLLQVAGVPSSEASGRQRAVMMIKLTGADGQSAALALVEVDPSFSTRNVLVADRRNGKPLNAAEGPWRVFIPTDLRHARWIRGLVLIDVVTIK